MNIEVVALDEDEGDGWQVKIHQEPVIASPCRHVCNLNAKRLGRAYVAGFAEAVEIVVNEIGFCREEAIALVQLLHQPAISTVH